MTLSATDAPGQAEARPRRAAAGAVRLGLLVLLAGAAMVAIASPGVISSLHSRSAPAYRTPVTLHRHLGSGSYVILVTSLDDSIVDLPPGAAVADRHGRHLRLNDQSISLSPDSTTRGGVTFLAAYEFTVKSGGTFTLTFPRRGQQIIVERTRRSAIVHALPWLLLVGAGALGIMSGLLVVMVSLLRTRIPLKSGRFGVE